MKESNKSRENNRFIISFQLATDLGVIIVIPLLAGTILGAYLDNRLGTKPIFILTGVGLGIVISTVSVIRIMNKLLD